MSTGLAVGQFATTQLGGRWTPAKAKFFDAWQRAEGTAARNNPFATTRRGYAGEEQFNSVGVKHYPSLAVGQRATLDTLKNGYYNNIVDLLKQDNTTAEQLAAAVAASPWGTGAGVLRVLGSKQASAYEQTTSRQKWGERKVIANAPFIAHDAVAAMKRNADLQARHDVASKLIERTNALLTPSEGWLSTLEKLGPSGQRVAAMASGFQPNAMPAEPKFEPVPAPVAAPPQSVAATSSGPEMGPGFKGKKFILPTKFSGTHVTDNLGWGTKSAHDWMQPAGTPLGAPESGVITAWDPKGAQGGGRIRIEADDGSEYWIGHIANAPKAGTRLKRGSFIGYVAYQNVSAPHVHEDER